MPTSRVLSPLRPLLEPVAGSVFLVLWMIGRSAATRTSRTSAST
ncbi:hypothetical protein [Clavibacter tessellarius]